MFTKQTDGTFTGTHNGVALVVRKVPATADKKAYMELTATVGESTHSIPIKSVKAAEDIETLDTVCRVAGEQEALRLQQAGIATPEPEATKKRNTLSYRTICINAKATIATLDAGEFNSETVAACLTQLRDMLSVVESEGSATSSTDSRRAREAYVQAGEVVPVDVLWKAGAMRDLHTVLAVAGAQGPALTIEQIASKLAELGHADFKGLQRYLAEMRRGIKLVPAGWFFVEHQDHEPFNPEQPDRKLAPIGPATYSIVPITEPHVYARVEQRHVENDLAQVNTRSTTWHLPAEPVV